MPRIYGLVRFFENIAFAKKFISGQIYASSLQTLKTFEESHAVGRVDPHEGSIGWLQPSQGHFVLDGQVINADLAGPVQIQMSLLDHFNVVCLHAMHLGTSNEAQLAKATLDEVNREIMIPDECFALGEYAVMLTDAPEFVRRMKAAADAKRYLMGNGLVRYYDPESDHLSFDNPLEAIFWKQDRYSHQREYRFAIFSGSELGVPLTIDIGDISDITMLMRSDDINSKFELKFKE